MVEAIQQGGARAHRIQKLRLLELDEPVRAAAAAAGMSVSEWIRQAIRRGLANEDGADKAPHKQADDAGRTRRLTLRADEASVRRWQREALEHSLSLTRYLDLQMSVTPERARRIAEVAATVRASLVQVSSIGRNLNQLARSWNTYPGQSTAVERQRLAELCEKVDDFCDRASRLTGEFEKQHGRRRWPTQTGAGEELMQDVSR